MDILAVDTSTTELGIGIVTGSGDEYAQRWKEIGHSEPLFPRIGFVLDRVDLGSGEIDLLAVVSGPGSFTGLRIGMAGLLGWGVSVGIPVQPVDTFAAMRASLVDVTYPLLVAIHSRGDEFYLQFYSSSGDAAEPYVGGVDSIVGQVSGDCLVCGSGAEKFVELAATVIRDRFRPAPLELRTPNLISVCREAERTFDGKANSDYDAEPYYMTLSQAEINFENNKNRDL
ncbi:MAG: tRNA (adenosine(37)-N6)-threonylcarbamoyltransferase complex dimerization subunit type 1 TsaB [Candidatus Zixiibacteriota bacterium]